MTQLRKTANTRYKGRPWPTGKRVLCDPLTGGRVTNCTTSVRQSSSRRLLSRMTYVSRGTVNTAQSVSQLIIAVWGLQLRNGSRRFVIIFRQHVSLVTSVTRVRRDKVKAQGCKITRSSYVLLYNISVHLIFSQISVVMT